MKKFVVILTLLFLLAACSTQETPTMAVKDYLARYNNLESNVINDMTSSVEKEELTKEQKEVYKSILEKQYKDMSYEILEEEIDGDTSYVRARVKVYDLYRAQNDSSNYLKDHVNEFYDENNQYNVSKYMDYKLNAMKEMDNKVEYTIVFTVNKKDDIYVVAQPNDMDLEKLHGVYNYDID